ncbi:MAG: hypothetical protein HRU03_01425 [Nanoarchaeales archaeon]|nr:hypothetical protein [Nanoarchaeales archaeon]
MIQSNLLSKFANLLILIFTLSLVSQISYGAEICGVEISEPWFQVLDNSGNPVLTIDNEGDMFILGQDHTLNNKATQSTFEIESIFFNSVTSNYNSISDNLGSIPSIQGLEIKNTLGTTTALLGKDNTIYSKGSVVAQGAQAACLPDGNYCQNTDIREYRNYFCDVTGLNTGSCTYTSSSQFSCSSQNYDFCSGPDNKDVYEKQFTCSGSGCSSSDEWLKTCPSSSTSLGTWGCFDITTKSRANIYYSPSCSLGSCGLSDATVTETQSCPGGQVCGGGSCSPGASCSFGIAHLGTDRLYKDSSVPYGSSCSSQIRSCFDGTLSGSNSYTDTSCSVQACIDSSWGPSQSSVCSGESFTQTSNCGTTRTVSGTSTRGVCAPSPSADNCAYGVGHGNSQIFYISTSVPFNSVCYAQMRTCDDGDLSGSYTATSCSVQSCNSNSWSPSQVNTCSTDTFTQTNECGDTRTISGTKSCVPVINGVCGGASCSCGSGSSSSCKSEFDNTFPRGYNWMWSCSGSDGGSSMSCNTWTACFTGDELVKTLSGEIEISKIKVGDIIISYDEKTNTFVENEVDQLLVHDGNTRPVNNFEKDPILELVIETNGIEKITKVTANHLYLDLENKKYKQIRKFNIGDKLTSINGVGIIKSMNKLDLIAIVYNLHMKNKPNNYLVNGIVVHNEKQCPGGEIC